MDYPPIVGLNPIAEAGFPEMACPVIFLPGCNMRCSYCMNAGVVKGTSGGKQYSVYEVVEYLRDNEESALLISGGEPTMHESLPEMVRFFVDSGFSVRLATNGTNFDMLEFLVKNKMVSFVAMDIKANPLNYERARRFYTFEQLDGLMRSIVLLNSSCEFPAREFDFEYRTTIFPPVITKDTIMRIAELIHPRAAWFLQQFRKNDSLLGFNELEEVSPYSRDELMEILMAAQLIVPNTHIRWP